MAKELLCINCGYQGKPKLMTKVDSDRACLMDMPYPARGYF